MHLKFFLLGWLLLVPAIVFAAPVVELSQIAGKAKGDVAKVLGEPDSVSQTKSGEKAHYKKGDIEIVFVNGKADWITVSAMGDVPFSPAALTVLGLKESPPSFKNANVIRWQGIPGFVEIAVFPGHKNCDYAYIEVLTRTK